jgi:UDP-glucose 4-epimerase
MSNSNMKWLITGGCGFIGTSLISQILKVQSDAHIRVLDNLTVGTREDLAEVCDFTEVVTEDIPDQSGVFLIIEDIRNSEIYKIAAGVECIVHLAANTGVGPSVETPRIDMESNVIGIFNLLECARINSVKNFIFASSGASVGNATPPIHEDMVPHPVSPYGASKLAGEAYCSSYFHTYGINTVALRFGNVYGPRSKNKSSVVAKFIKQSLEGETCEIYGDGSQTRDFIYIDDLIDAIIKSSNYAGGGEVFQISTGAEVELNDLVEKIKIIFSEKTGCEMKVMHGNKRQGDVLHNYVDVRKANKHLGWQAKTNLDEGLANTIDDLSKLFRKV